MRELIINVPFVYMAQDVMILMQENPFWGPMEGMGPKNRDFFWPKKVPPPQFLLDTIMKGSATCGESCSDEVKK
jgi:hypothetical protein